MESNVCSYNICGYWNFKHGGGYDTMDKASSRRTIMHIDVNSAFLFWKAVYNLQMG